MDLLLRERFARLGPIRAVDRVSCGSPADVVVRLQPREGIPKPIDAMLALARRGLPMLKAKHAIEHSLEDGLVRVQLPIVEDHRLLRDELAKAGFAVEPVDG